MVFAAQGLHFAKLGFFIRTLYDLKEKNDEINIMNLQLHLNRNP